MISSNTVVILMATYNGAKHLYEQLDSIIAQTYTNWQLIIRDDGSNDTTVKVIEQYSADKRIKLINTPSKFKGASVNFSALYKWAQLHMQPQFLMFADQDDIWHPQKIEKTFAALNASMQKQPGKPAMVYTHFYMITEEGQPISDEFVLLPQLDFNRTLAQNYALGCTQMLNRPLMDLMPDIPPTAENHDYWVALVASALGDCIFINEHLMQYRQHAGNVTAQGSSFGKRLKRFTIGLNRQVKSLEKRVIMLSDFYGLYEAKLKPYDRIMLYEYLKAYGNSLLSLVNVIIKYKIYKLNALQNLGFVFVAASCFRHLKKLVQS